MASGGRVGGTAVGRGRTGGRLTVAGVETGVEIDVEVGAVVVAVGAAEDLAL